MTEKNGLSPTNDADGSDDRKQGDRSSLDRLADLARSVLTVRKSAVVHPPSDQPR